MTATMPRPPDEVDLADLDAEVDLAIDVLGHPTAEQDDRLLERIGYPSVREQERISAAIIAAEQADVDRTWREKQMRLLTPAERKRGATAQFDSHLGVWVADGKWVLVRDAESQRKYRKWQANPTYKKDTKKHGKGTTKPRPVALLERVDITAGARPPEPAKFTYKCRCGRPVERTRRARKGGPIYCSAKCKQASQRRKPVTPGALPKPATPLPGTCDSPDSGTDPPDSLAHIGASVTPDPTERTTR